MIHERLDVDHWVKRFPLAGIGDANLFALFSITGPQPIAYIEQIRSDVKKKSDLGKPVPVDLCVWKLGDSERRDVTKIGGLPYWPANEQWPTFGDRKPFSFMAQFCFADSRDILPRLPGDILSVLVGDGHGEIELRWFRLGEKNLLPAKDIPLQQWAIQPCHAVLHRTAEYPDSSYGLFQKYPNPISRWATRFTDGSKIGGSWELRGEIPNPADFDDPDDREYFQGAWDRKLQQEKMFFCQLGSISKTAAQPFVNVNDFDDLSQSDVKNLLMIADCGGCDFFFDGKLTDSATWGG
jgi:hypothetical protein